MKKFLLISICIISLLLVSCTNKPISNKNSSNLTSSDSESTSTNISEKNSSTENSSETKEVSKNQIKQKYDMLYPICVNKKYGFIDIDGNVVIEPQYDETNDFSEGLAHIKKDELEGFIDLKGNFIFKSSSSFQDKFSDGLLIDSLEYINNKGKVSIKIDDSMYRDILIPNIMSDTEDWRNQTQLSSFNDGIAQVGYWTFIGAYPYLMHTFYIDKGGKTYFKNPGCIYESSDFSDGYALISCNGYQMYIDTDFKIKFIFYNTSDNFNLFSNFTEGYAAIHLPVKSVESIDISKFRNEIKNKFSQYYDSNNVKEFYCGKPNGLYGYLNKKGEIWGNYDFANSFYEGKAIVRKDGKYACIDKKGNTIFTSQYILDERYSDGMIAYYSDEKLGFLNEKGEIVIKAQYQICNLDCPSGYHKRENKFTDGLAFVYKDGIGMYINKSGKVIWSEKPVN